MLQNKIFKNEWGRFFVKSPWESSLYNIKIEIKKQNYFQLHVVKSCPFISILKFIIGAKTFTPKIVKFIRKWICIKVLFFFFSQLKNCLFTRDFTQIERSQTPKLATRKKINQSENSTYFVLSESCSDFFFPSRS